MASVGGRVTDLFNLRDQKAHFAITTVTIGKIQTHIIFYSWWNTPHNPLDHVTSETWLIH